MQTATIIPMNTMLADLDEALRQLMTESLTDKGFDGVEISFDAPNKEWSAQLSAPTVNLFLYDLRESPEEHPMDWEGGAGDNGRASESRPPIRLDASFAVSAWIVVRLRSGTALTASPTSSVKGRLTGLPVFDWTTSIVEFSQ